MVDTIISMLTQAMHSSRGSLALKFALKLRSVILVFWLIIEVLSSRSNQQSSHCSLNNEGSCEKYSAKQFSHCSLNNEGSCEKYSEEQFSHCSLSHMLENSEIFCDEQLPRFSCTTRILVDSCEKQPPHCSVGRALNSGNHLGKNRKFCAVSVAHMGPPQCKDCHTVTH